MKLKVACVQFTAGPDWASHRLEVTRLIRQAAEQGAQFVATPENTSGIQRDKLKARAEALVEDQHTAVAELSELAKELNIWLLCGSVSVRNAPEDERLHNRSLLFAPSGEIIARYNKIHLFDVDLLTGESHRESTNIAPGDKAVLAGFAGIKLGMSVCYDIRFPQLYRTLAQAGAQLLAVPAAFTVPTGQAHWEVLLRARAIENTAYVIAPAQTGTHDGGRQTYGHSLIIDPWGKVLADAGTEPGIITAELDLAAQLEVRRALPSLQHDRIFSL